MLLLSFTGV
jgi:hypothetical protein